MRTILIVFAILLVLLTLLGTFGGSIKYREPFYELSTFAEQEQRQQKLRFEDMPQDNEPPSQVGGMEGIADSFPVDNYPVESFYDAIPPTPGDYDKARFLDLPKAPQLGASQPQPPAMPNTVSNFEPSMEGFMIEPFEEESRSSFPAAY